MLLQIQGNTISVFMYMYIMRFQSTFNKWNERKLCFAIPNCKAKRKTQPSQRVQMWGGGGGDDHKCKTAWVKFFTYAI